ncbi:major facilitator superfamily domain-containing protein [Mucidula mucida]|nr:major facilitator superfamily domain-containing protein [Mucidula mucida]
MSLKDPSSPIDEKQSVDDVKVPEVDHDAEVGYDIYASTKDNLVFTPAEERAIIRKIDLWILPCFCFTQGLAFLDKTALNYGNLFGMKADLHVNSAQYSWFAGAFYFGYLVSVEPSTWLLQRLVHTSWYHTGKIMGTVCTVWGVVVMTMAACNSFAGAMVNRFFLGALEACVTPGLGLMTPFWWRIREQPVRHLSWRLVRLGSLTTAWGLYILIMLPDSPVTARFSTIAKRPLPLTHGHKNKNFKLYQAVQAFQDPKTWLLILAAAAAQIPNGVVTNFSSIIQILSLVGSGYLAGKFKNSRAILMFIGNATCIIAAACLTYAPQEQKWGRLVAFWFTSFSSVGFAMGFVMVSANIAGPHTLIDSEEDIGYPTATKAMLAGYTVKTGCHILLGLYMWYENRRRDALAAVSGDDISEDERARLAEEAGMNDVTESDNKYFRYVL